MPTATDSNELLSSVLFWAPPLIGGGGMFVRTIFVLLKRSSRPRPPAPQRTNLARLALYIQVVLLVLGFGVYSASLFVPATKIPVPDTGKVVTGLGALIWGFPFWGINLWFLACPLLILWISSIRDFWVQFIAFVVQLGCALVVYHVAMDPEQRSGSGFYLGGILWSNAFWLVLAAYAIPTSLIRETKKQLPEKPAREWTV